MHQTQGYETPKGECAGNPYATECPGMSDIHIRTLLLGPAFAIERALMDKNGLHFYVRSS